MLFALGTTNTPKTQAVTEVLTACPYTQTLHWEIQNFSVASDVPDMPLSLLDLRNGAKNRVAHLRRICSEADFFLGMEGGVYHDFVGSEYWLTGLVYIENQNGRGHFGYSCHMQVPEKVVGQLLDGTHRDLEEIMASLGAPENIGDKHGSFAVWSDNMLTRTDQFRLATQCALVPFFNSFYQ